MSLFSLCQSYEHHSLQLTFCRTWLKEALKRNDAETAIKEAETAKYIAEKQHSLKQKIAAKARELLDLTVIESYTTQ